MITLSEPGLFAAVDAADYHADCAPEPSLSSSLGKVLLNQSPLHAWYRHPRLNAAAEERAGSRGMELGSAVHAMILDRGADIVAIDADDYRKKAAQELRDEAKAAGKTPLLRADYETALDMAVTATAYLQVELPALLSDDAMSEAVMLWREGPAWCRAMMDRITADRLIVLDIKTTARSARVEAATRTIFDMGYHFQSAFYERGLNVLFPDGAGRRKFMFLFQEDAPPYACQLVRLDEASLTIARKQVMAAIGIWRRCMETSTWPGYPGGIRTATMPEWMQQQWIAREMADDSLTGDDGQPPETESNKQMEWTP